MQRLRIRIISLTYPEMVKLAQQDRPVPHFDSRGWTTTRIHDTPTPMLVYTLNFCKLFKLSTGERCGALLKSEKHNTIFICIPRFVFSPVSMILICTVLMKRWSFLFVEYAKIFMHQVDTDGQVERKWQTVFRATFCLDVLVHFEQMKILRCVRVNLCSGERLPLYT